MKTQAAGCSRAIKKELEAKFPSIKFSVKSKNFAGGNDVNIHWNLGPTVKEVEAITDKYQYGHFNGMDDIYEYSNTRKDIPQVKYVLAHRDICSNEELAAIKHNEKLQWGDPARIDLWKQGKSLTQSIAYDICKLCHIVYFGPVDEILSALLPGTFTVNGRGPCMYFRDLVNQLLADTPLMTGYHGVKKTINENGIEIQNDLMIF